MAAPAAVVSSSPATAADEPRESKVWQINLVVLLLAIVAIRLHEVVPALSALRPALVLGVGGFIALWAASAQRSRSAVLSDPSLRWVVLYAVWAAITVPFAMWPGQGAGTLRSFLPAILLVAAVLLLVPSERTIVRVLFGFVIASAINALAMVALASTTAWGRALVGGGSLDSNDLALVMAITFPMALGVATRLSGWRRLACLGAALALVLSTTATGSRGGTIAFLVGALVFVLGQRGSRKFVFLGLLVVAGVFAWFNASRSYRYRMTELVKGEKDYNYTAYGGRKQIWERARLYTIQHPIVGVGVGNFPVAEGEHLETLGMVGKWSNAHNAYLQAFAELGFPGGLIFLGMLISTGLRAAKHWRPRSNRSGGAAYHRPELLAAVLAFAAGSYFLSTAYFYSFFALVGLIALSDRISSRVLSGVSAQPGALRGKRSQRGWLGNPAAPAIAPGGLLLRGRPD